MAGVIQESRKEAQRNGTGSVLQSSGFHVFGEACGPLELVLKSVDFINNLALLYLDEERLADAEPLLLRSLAIHEKLPEHLAAATALHNLALLCSRQNRFAKAESFALRALALRERFLGAEHPETARSLHAIASLYHPTRPLHRCRAALRPCSGHLGKGPWSHSPLHRASPKGRCSPPENDEHELTIFRRPWALHRSHRSCNALYANVIWVDSEWIVGDSERGRSGFLP
jgi:hypothetical protein